VVFYQFPELKNNNTNLPDLTIDRFSPSDPGDEDSDGDENDNNDSNEEQDVNNNTS